MLKKIKALTLIEVVAALGILGLMALMLFPALQSVEKQRERRLSFTEIRLKAQDILEQEKAGIAQGETSFTIGDATYFSTVQYIPRKSSEEIRVVIKDGENNEIFSLSGIKP